MELNKWLTIVTDAKTGVSVVVCDDEAQARAVMSDELSFEDITQREIDEIMANVNPTWTNGVSSLEIKCIKAVNVELELKELRVDEACTYAEFVGGWTP